MVSLKELILGILTIAINVAVFWVWNQNIASLAAGEFGDYLKFTIPVAGLILSASFFALSAIFIEKSSFAYGSLLAGVMIPYFFVTASNTLLLLLAASVFVVSFAVYRIRREFLLSQGFSVSKIIKSGVPAYFTVTAIIVSSFYLAQMSEEKAFAVLLPKPVLDLSLRTISGPLQSLTNLPNFNPEAKIDELLAGLLDKQLKESGLSLSQLPKKELEKALASQKDELLKSLGIKTKITGNEKVSDVLYHTVEAKIEDLAGPYKKYLPLAAAITFFLAFKTLTFPLYYLTIITVFILIKIFVFAKILRNEKQQIEVERLSI